MFYLFETKEFIVVFINANPGYSYKTVIVNLYTYGSLLVTTGLDQPKCPPEISANCNLHGPKGNWNWTEFFFWCSQSKWSQKLSCIWVKLYSLRNKNKSFFVNRCFFKKNCNPVDTMRLFQTRRSSDKSLAHNSLCVDTRWGFTITPAAYSRRNLFPSVAGLRGYIIKGRVLLAGAIAAPPSARHSRPDDVTGRHYHTESLLTPVTPVVFRWSTYEPCQNTRPSGIGSCGRWLMAFCLEKCQSCRFRQ